MADGEMCPEDRISTVETCQQAAAELGLQWGHAYEGETDSPGRLARVLAAAMLEVSIEQYDWPRFFFNHSNEFSL